MASYILNSNKNLPPVLLPSESYHLNPLDNKISRSSFTSSTSSSPVLTSFPSNSPPSSFSTTSFSNDSPLPFSTNKPSSFSNSIVLPSISTSFIESRIDQNSQNIPQICNIPTEAPRFSSTIKPHKTAQLSISPKNTSNQIISPKHTTTQTILPETIQAISPENSQTSSDILRRVSVPLEANQIILDFSTDSSGSPSSTSTLENSSISFESFSSASDAPSTTKSGRSLSISASSTLSSSISHRPRRRHSSKLIVESFNDTIHNKLKKRQRNGPSCDNCRIKKIKCDAKIIILKKLTKNFVKPNKVITDFNPSNYGISKNEYLKTIEYYKVLNNDFDESGFTVFESGSNLIQFKSCSCCLNKKLSCDFTKGFTKADILEYNKTSK